MNGWWAVESKKKLVALTPLHHLRVYFCFSVSPDTGAEVRAKKAHVDLEADRQRQRERFNLALQANRNRDAAYEKIEMAAVKKDQLTDFPEGDPALEAPQNVISSTDIQPAIDHKIAYTAV